ncbi:pseudaminic acid cytidylyltransferase [Maribacter sp. CXY002]|uniref:pseudaminic acid cytidylyltransferase n=1 Tax=Maribacter luteocoastalis TaxID=3407671 RepID=UPI003B672F6D
MSSLLIIPARGGSKRIPRKNIKEFLGKPIIAYSIQAAISSHLFDEIIVSTDDEEIAKIAIEYGAKVPFLRSGQNSDDHATTYDVVHEVVSKYKEQNKTFEYTCCLYACAPFVTAAKLKEALEVLNKNDFDSVFPVMSFDFPIQRALKRDEHKIVPFYPEFNLIRSQDLEKAYHDAGQFYWMQTAKCMNKKAIITDNTGSIKITELEGQDIDSETDWKLAELKYELLHSLK